jgi:hypothetical protein
MAISTMDGLIAALASGQKRDFHKLSVTAEGAGTWHSLWKAQQIPVAGANPGSLAGVVPTSATTGALTFTDSATSYLAQMWAAGATAGTLILYDRLWHNSTMDGTQTVDTTLGSVPALTRPDANGADVEMWGEIYTAIGATARTLTVKYTNQAGTTGQSATYAHPANAESVGQMFPLTLAAGDTGVRVPTSYSWSASTGTAGDFGVTLLRRIGSVTFPLVETAQVADFAMLGLPLIYNGACLALMVFCSTTNTGNIQGSIVIAQG